MTLRKAVGGDLTAALMKLFKSGFAPSQQNVAADFAAQEATFTGYAASMALTFSAVVVDANGDPVVQASNLFTQTGNTITDSIGGFWLETAGGKVIQFGVFPQPVNMAAAGRFINVNVYVNGVNQSYADVQS